MFFTPYFTKYEGEKDWVYKNFKSAYLFTALLVGYAALFIGIFAKPIVVLLYGDTYISSGLSPFALYAR